MSTTPPDTLTAALAWHAAGASVVRAAADGTKRPLGQWRDAQTTRADSEQLHRWFAAGYPGLGVVMGQVSGALETLEFEGRAVAEGLPSAYREIVEASGLGPVWDRAVVGYSDRTPSGGLHITWRIADGPVPGNTKLAARPARPDELTDDERQVAAARPGKVFRRDLIETRGEGGFVVVAPSFGAVHPSGLPYTRLGGGPDTIATITSGEADALREIARMLDQLPQQPDPAPMPGQDPAAQFLAGSQPQQGGGLRPGDDFEQRTSWADILVPHGWTHIHTSGRTSYWRRPGKPLGVSATTGRDPSRDRLYVFTSSTEFTPETPYTKFGAWALLEHRGDHRAAARALRHDGYGQPAEQPPVRHLTAVPNPAPAVAAAPMATDGTAALHITPPAPLPGTHWPDSFTDDGNAVLFADHHHEHLRYVPERGRWMRWAGHRWAWDDLGETVELARTLLRALDPLDLNGGDDVLKAARRHRSTSLSRRGITACLGLAQSDQRIAISATALDTARRHLNTPGGIIDLTTGTLSPSNPAALHSRSTTVTPNPNHPTPRWTQFLADTFAKDSELIAFVQRLSGYSASADTGTHVLPFLHGPGGNGKSVLVDVFQALLGDYAGTAPAGFLMTGRQEHSEELARLQGLRLVVASEANPGASWDEAKLKELTGGDMITARYMHQSFFEFKPTHHLWLMANHQPRVKGGGNSFWRRLRLIPFTETVPEDKKILNLAQLLVAEEGPGILAWLVAGAVAYFSRGLAEPAPVLAATRAYAAEEDQLGRFLEDCCRLGGAGHVRIEAGRLRTAYEAWCAREGERALDARMLGRELKGRGIARKPSNGRYFYDGLALTVDESTDFLEGR